MLEWLVKTTADLLSFVAGLVMGGAASLWWRHTVHDSVMRYAHLKPNLALPDAMRSTFCAIVNGKMELLDRHGREIGIVRSKAVFYGAMVLIIVASALGLSFMALVSEAVRGWMQRAPLFFPTCELVAALLVLGYCYVRLKLPKHRTLLITHTPPPPAAPGVPPEPSATKWVRLTAERGDDGLPTKNLEVKPGEGPPGLW